MFTAMAAINAMRSADAPIAPSHAQPADARATAHVSSASGTSHATAGVHVSGTPKAAIDRGFDGGENFRGRRGGVFVRIEFDQAFDLRLLARHVGV